ncbi:hypothetical protein BE08_10215 [Sorangium cellulosum]|uniref:Uncharacterized protein n=1 Tax=Sorangium cellulosum TaxID=56 RepID=A0A150PFE4_SORCE|nr:hypothetical protein BE08_10215 [Sorangium cellulosum]
MTGAEIAGETQHAAVCHEPDPARASGRARLTTQELVEQLIEQGRMQGWALAIIDLYEARFGPMPPALRAVVEAMRDLSTLERWNRLAATGTREEVHDAFSSNSAGRSP